jgi:hypothetical protein
VCSRTELVEDRTFWTIVTLARPKSVAMVSAIHVVGKQQRTRALIDDGWL